ncbi:MAG: hypothetical protein ABSD58_04025 [Verrucomicrobiia bacterium]
MIALQNQAFAQSFRIQRTAKQLAGNLLATIRAEFENANLPQDRTEDLVQAFSFITCIMVLTAHRPHPKGKKTWFGYWRDDGFIKTKHRGRIDANEVWPDIRAKWVSAYRSREITEGFSVMREVTAQNEWCAEAYLETDYDSVSRESLAGAAKRYVLNNVMLLHECRIRDANEKQD